MNLKKIILIAFIFSGMTALIYEVTWIRPLQLIFGSTTYTVSIIFSTFMSGLAVGSMMMGKFVDRIKDLPGTYALLLFGIGMYGILLIPAFNSLPHLYSTVYNLSSHNFILFSIFQFILFFVLLLLPTTLMGATFPVVVKFYTEEKVGKGVGEIYSANNIGAIVGSFSAGFILIPLIGIKWTIVGASTINLLVASLVLFLVSRKFALKIISFVFLVFIILALLLNYNIRDLAHSRFFYMGVFQELIENSEPIFYKESLYGTVIVSQYPGGGRALLINGKGQGGTAITDLRSNSLTAYIPLLLHLSPKNSLNIGLGTGTTSGILARFTNTKTVEIDSAVVLASKYFEEINKRPLQNPSHKLIIADARNWLLATKEKFDIITSYPSDPWQEKSVWLYSKEFFEIVKEHLNENGLFVQWTPIYDFSPLDFRSFYKTFHSVFPYVLIFVNQNFTLLEKEGVKVYKPTELILVGSISPISVDEALVNMKFDLMKDDLNKIGIHSSKEFFDLLVFDQDQLDGYGNDAPLITDDRPILEFSTPKEVFLKAYTAEDVLKDIENFVVKNYG
jgi:spermidine synthase